MLAIIQGEKRAPDGYTLLMGGIANAINPAVYKNMSYDPVRDFDAISLVASVPGIIVSHPSLPIRSIKELRVFGKSSG